MRQADFGNFYRFKKTFSSYDLSLLTPYIKLYPLDSDSSSGYVTKSVKRVSIKQDNDVIVFNKIVAQMQFAPDDLIVTNPGFSGRVRNKFNYMDNTQKIFDQGSIWVLECGWTGPKTNRRLKKLLTEYPLFTDYKTYRTLLKTSLALNKNKYTGTMQFCRRAFQNFRDFTVPFDSILSGLYGSDIYLVEKDWLLDRSYANQLDSANARSDTLIQVGKKRDQIAKIIRDTNTKLNRDLLSYVRRTDSNKKDQYKKSLQESQKQLKQLNGKKWCTVRFLLTVLRNFLKTSVQNYNGYKIAVSGQVVYPDMRILLDSKKKDQGAYSNPLKIRNLIYSAGVKQIIDTRFIKKDDQPYKDQYTYDNRGRTYERVGISTSYNYNNRGDTLIDLYALNKKLYETNIIQCLSKINDYIMPGFPKIRIVYDDIKKIYRNNSGQILSVRWALPQISNDQILHLYYDGMNQLYQNFSIQLPVNNQMLKINQTSVQNQTTNQSQGVKALKGIANSIKKICIPRVAKKENDSTTHNKLKHKMYQNMVLSINTARGNKTLKPVKRQLQGNKKFAGIIQRQQTDKSCDKIIIYYFSNNESQINATDITRYYKGDGADVIQQMQNYITRNMLQDVSMGLIAYLSNSLKISVDLHGIFNVPVFSGYIVTHDFPGPISKIDGQNKRWVNGKYIIVGMQTIIDRSTIKTVLKANRIPQVPNTPDQSSKQIQKLDTIRDVNPPAESLNYSRFKDSLRKGQNKP